MPLPGSQVTDDGLAAAFRDQVEFAAPAAAATTSHCMIRKRSSQSPARRQRRNRL